MQITADVSKIGKCSHFVVIICNLSFQVKKKKFRPSILSYTLLFLSKGFRTWRFYDLNAKLADFILLIGCLFWHLTSCKKSCKYLRPFSSMELLKRKKLFKYECFKWLYPHDFERAHKSMTFVQIESIHIDGFKKV